MNDRRQESYSVRLRAAKLAKNRNHPLQKANGDEQRYAQEKFFMSFTKGLPHNPDTGLLQDPQDFVALRRAIDEGFIDPFTNCVRHGAKYKVENNKVVKESNTKLSEGFRQWEAPTAGIVFDLEGQDAQAVTMPPAPPLIADGEANDELVLEMAEVYELAILRDVPFNSFEGKKDNELKDSLSRLNALPYIKKQTGRRRKVNKKTDKLDLQTVFRGSSPGVEVGPYLSQFLLMGNQDLNDGGSVTDGLITYGVLQIDQKVPVATPDKDFMTDMDTYVKIQRGIDPKQLDPSDQKKQKEQTYILADGKEAIAPDRPVKRFISTPRDLSTYVHFDALYEAYLNACLILLGMKAPFDPCFDGLSGGGVASENTATRRHAAGFALYGGPHILTLVTEVATRALKAVRFQKFNNHIRLRPEALAARIELLREPGTKDIPPQLREDIGQLKSKMGATLEAVSKLSTSNGTHFLPMAFAEGSPMHPAYGAGHATVAGACVTILKAFFDTNAVLVGDKNKPDNARFKRCEPGDTPIVFRTPEICKIIDKDAKLVADTPKKFLTLEGELNKLAANISIGRDMAGVHFFSDYYDSLRMGEEIAIGILKEQALTYPTDRFIFSIPTFDGGTVRIGCR